MSLFIDTANVDEAGQAKALGWVRGITTNPILLKNAGDNAEDILSCLAELDMGPVFYQLVSSHEKDMLRELDRAENILKEKLVVKIPATEAGFRFALKMPTGIPFCITAVYSAAQALVAREAGAAYVAVYVNRATRLMGDGLALTRDIAAVLERSSTHIVAASIKSPDEASSATCAGAHHLTMPLDVLKTLTTTELSEQAVKQFTSNGRGIHL